MLQKACTLQNLNAIKRNIPNFLTSMNLVCGCLAIVLLLNQMPTEAAYLMFAAAVFDFFDGLVARALKVTSPIGKDLDSLADMVTFGLLPGLMITHMCLAAGIHPWLSLTGLIIPVFSALRLARFNNDTEQSYSFKGLATPANGLFWACIQIVFFNSIKSSFGIHTWGMQLTHTQREYIPLQPFWLTDHPDWLGKLIYHYPFALPVIAVLLSLLLVSRLDLIAFKLHQFSVKRYMWHFILLGASLVSIILWGFASAPIILFLYILISQIHFRLNKHEI